MGTGPLCVQTTAKRTTIYQGDGKGKFEDVASLPEWRRTRMELNKPIWEWPWATTYTQGACRCCFRIIDIEYAALYRNEGGMNFTDVSIGIGNCQRHPRVCGLGKRHLWICEQWLGGLLPGETDTYIRRWIASIQASSILNRSFCS